MSVYIHRELACDHGGAGTFSCNRALHSAAGQNTPKLRREAKSAGWSRKNGVDRCPDHTSPSPSQEGGTGG